MRKGIIEISLKRDCSTCRWALPSLIAKIYCSEKRKHKSSCNVGGGCNSWSDFSLKTEELENAILNNVRTPSWHERLCFEKGREYERNRLMRLFEKERKKGNQDVGN